MNRQAYQKVNLFLSDPNQLLQKQFECGAAIREHGYENVYNTWPGPFGFRRWTCLGYLMISTGSIAQTQTWKALQL